MNIIVITTDELFYLPLTFQRLLESSARNNIKKIILLPPSVGNQTWFDIISEQLRFGLFYFVYRGFQYLYFKVLAKFNLKMHRRFFSVRSVAEYYNVPVMQIDKINSDRAIRIIEKDSPDLLVSISAGQIFKEKIISIPKWGTINVHNSPLPRYQGLMPSFWVLCNGEPETATTIHYMEKDIDTGNIILQQKIAINDETLDSMIKKMKLVSVGALLKVFKLFIEYKGNPPVIENQTEKATYYTFPKRADIKKFRKSGRKILWKNIY